MASCQIKRNEITGEITKVLAPNGETSLLYKDAKALLGNEEQAVDLWATAYTPSFKYRYGDWESLAREVRIGNTQEADKLSSAVSITLDKNGEPPLSSLSDYYPKNIKPKESNSVLRNKISNFLTGIGVSVETAVLPSGVEAQADLLSSIIKVANNEVSDTILGEEAAHFFVAMLPQDSTLLRDMMNTVTSTQTYRDVLQTYAKNPQYQTNGKPNFNKLKMEAIGKLVADNMSGDITQVSFWNRIWNYVRGLFTRKNPFGVAADNILESKVEGLNPIDVEQEDSIMYYLSSNDPIQVYNSIVDINNRTVKRASQDIDRETGKSIDKYYIDGKEIKRRVTNLAKDFYKKVFPNPTTGDKREMYNLQAEKGTAIHADIENIIARLVDSEGRLKGTPSARPSSFNTSETVYNMLEANMIERLTGLTNKYGRETRFLTEMKIVDPNRDIAGTVDLLVIKPNGRVDIYDWKSMAYNNKAALDRGIPWWKEEAYTIQLDEYAKILKANYNIDVDLKRAVPIRALFAKDSAGKRSILAGIEIGGSTVLNDKTYLNPVPSRTEKTGIRSIDDLLDQLRGLANKIKDRKVSLDERYARNEELDKIKRAINDIQLRSSLDGLVENGNLLLNNIQKAINEDTLTLNQAQIYFKEVELYVDIAKIKTAMGNNNFTKDQSDNIYNLSGRANEMYNSLKDWLLNAGNEVANTAGVNDITRIEKNVGFWKGMIRSISNSPNATVQTFYKYLTEFQDKIMESRNQNNEELSKLKTELEAWAKDRGISNDRIFDGILEIDNKGRWNGSFLNKYSKEFRDAKKKAIEDGDIKKLEELLDMREEAKKRFDKRKEGFIKWLQDTEFSLDSQKNTEIKNKRLESWNVQNNVFDPKYKKTALLNYNNGLLGKDIYVTDKWRELHSNSSSPLLKVYNYFQQQLSYADDELGMIDNNGKFIPNIENDKLDMWAQYGDQSIFNLKGFFEGFEYKTNTTVGEVDPITGKAKKSVPKLFLNNLGQVKTDEISGEEYTDFSMKSRDLFSVFSIWGKHMAEYEYMSKLEEIGSLMLTIEDIKGKHLEKGRDGKYIEVEGNAKNHEYLEDFQNYFVYGKKTSTDNHWEFDLFGKHYSGKALLTGGIRYMGMKTLALNTTSIVANAVGGKFNTYFVGSKGKFFNKKQWGFGEYALSTDKGKGLVDYFDIFLEDETYKRARQLSLYDSVKKLTWDHVFIGQRLTDKWVQYPVLLAMTQSYGVVNGSIVNIKEYVQSQNGYQNIYNLPTDEQQALLKKIDAEVEAMSDKSIYSLTKVNDEGKIEIEGLNRGDKTILEFRNAVKRANRTILGNASSEDISRYRMSLLGQALGQFRNWMPALIDERFGELRYNIDIDGWQKGKARVFFDNYFSSTSDEQGKSKQVLEILTRHVGTLVKDFVGFTSTGDVQSRAKILYAKEKARAIESGISFDITEHEYIELHMQNLRSMLNEIRLIVAFIGIPFAIGAALPPDKKKKTGIAKYITRMMDKFNNELLFYYIPTNFTQLIKAPIPAIGLLEDVFKFFQHLVGQGYAEATDDDALRKKYKPTKYLFKDVPIAKEVYTLGTIFNEDMRKAYGVTN